MNVNGPQSDPRYRIDPTERYTQEDPKWDQKKKKKVAYQGRLWGEEEKSGLMVKDHIPKGPAIKDEGELKPSFERILLAKANVLFDHLTNLEDKAAQLCFLITDANYDILVQKSVGQAVQKWQVGGLLFESGTHKRQAYLIEYYQRLAKLPLLMGNEYLHNLTFYFQESSTEHCLTMMNHFSDLGKTLMGQNRLIGVHFLYDHDLCIERARPSFKLNELQRKAMRKGIREAQGVVARNVSPKNSLQIVSHASFSLSFSSLSSESFGEEGSKEIMSDKRKESKNIHPTVGMRTLFFFSLSVDLDLEGMKEQILEFFEDGSDAFLLKQEPSLLIQALCELVSERRLSEKELDKKVMKILIMKSFFF